MPTIINEQFRFRIRFRGKYSLRLLLNDVPFMKNLMRIEFLKGNFK